MWGNVIATHIAENVTVQLHHDLTFRWSRVAVLKSKLFDDFFGVIDYETLKAANAVIDVPKKTITIRQLNRSPKAKP